MVAYILYGVFWSLIMDLANQGISRDVNYNNVARVLAILFWPLFVIIFLYHFFKGLFGGFGIGVILFVGLFTSCSTEDSHENPFVLGSPAVVNNITQSGDIFTFYAVDESYIQDVYLDTLQTVPYFKLFTEASKMKDEYLYNGEHNVWGEYLSDQPYVETGSQFRLSTQATDYDLPQGKIYGRNVIGIRDNQAIEQNQVITIYIEVYFDGYHREYDTVRIRLNAL